jgi:glucose-6-phosphate dehydrogenase assembly protein OpcA
MSVNPQLESFTAGLETVVDLDAIQRQLKQLWRLAAETSRDPAGRVISRACLFTLLGFCDSAAQRDRAADALRALTSRHPCRAILLRAEPDSSPPALTASITAHCHLAGAGAKQVCCEQISINAAGDAVEQLATAVLPLLESDLPTILWWQPDRFQPDDVFQRLCAVADRVIFDSSTWPAQPGLAELFTRIGETMRRHDRCQFADLSWTRLGWWQKLTADMFEDAPCRSQLEQINRIEIAHGGGDGARLRAVLYAAWFAAQTGWSADQIAGRVRLTRQDRPDADAAGLLRIRLQSPAATFNIRRSYGERTAIAVVEMPTACGLPRKRAFWPTDDLLLLSQELDSFQPHQLYARSLPLAAALATHLP